MALFVLAGCGSGSSVDAVPGERIACALDGDVDFRDLCTVERKGMELVVHRPDGGFRRFELAATGSVAALDGADAVTVNVRDGEPTELAIGGDRYRVNLGNSDAGQP